MEAALSLLVMGMMLISLPAPHPVTLKELQIIQQENDLLKIWSAKGFEEVSARQEVIMAFGNNAELVVGEHAVAFSGNNVISSDAIILDNSLNEVKVRVLVQLS